ncbi:hypothetical protein SSP24_74600 [Streptomyces spinoverrucosus]|uniref:YkuD domain-containing protein n=1 Tax=Streptomyces spinoverrucosus TaxID=284043 RepID=A0A4Y3VUP1_9ACTN|nr:hypothetical protein [Streptomyces spinoverrucosus]GEC09805.1 hypothetical protein SSP24_74600 [Streptomyces spinoverrucosus]GHB96875.1 hypothetical protein GCM10010397_81790 [Streptomyces spinoverrucosus]
MSDDLTTGLRELAASGQTPPPVPGADIRYRAAHRRRRRRTTAALTGAGTVLALALALLLHLGGVGPAQQPPAAAHPTTTTSPTPSPLPAADVTVDLRRKIMFFGGRVLFLSPMTGTPPTGRMTVVSKTQVKEVSGAELGYKSTSPYQIYWVIELRGDHGTTAYMGGMHVDANTPDDQTPRSDWIILQNTDAKSVYGQLRPGSVVNIETTVPTASESPSLPSATPTTATVG